MEPSGKLQILKLTGRVNTLRKAKEAAQKAKKRKDETSKRAIANASASARRVTLKAGGTFVFSVREAIKLLIGLGLPEANVGEAFHVLGRALGIEITDSIARRSVGRMAREAYIESYLQVADEIIQSKCTHHRYLA